MMINFLTKESKMKKCEEAPIEDCIECGEPIYKEDKYIHVIETFMTVDADIEVNKWDSLGIYCLRCGNKLVSGK